MKSIRNYKNIIYWMATALIFLAVIIGSTITVCGQNSDDDKVWDEYYSVLEEDYKEAVRDYVSDYGFPNAGIAITHTVDSENHREYTVKLHHSSLGYLEEDARTLFCEEIKALGFEDENCEFRVVIF